MLICPGCQADGSWVTDLDRCALCASIHLVRRLGEVECRDCGAVGREAAGPGVDVTLSVGGEGARDSLAAGLAEEVEQALARVLRRPAAPPGQRAPASTALAAGRIGFGCSGLGRLRL